MIFPDSHARCQSSATFTVVNDRGLHTRPSTELVKRATGFKSQIHLLYRRQEVNAKSLLGILTLAAPRGAKIKVMAEGEDAAEAVAALLELADHSFNFKY
ncbi:Phosphocarrier protein HPr [Chlamydiales bacterium SCGC AG-110-P3]|nr:Phosphocarrier protein HPr [Chlamydiales bacterium SCGC AG-110-P3]